MHSFGYSHGDLKPDNICARVGNDGTFKFTLIDLGVASKIPKIGEETKHKSFRGNFMFSSPEHIATRRASALDDLYSLLCVAFTIVFGNLPWMEYMQYKLANVQKNEYKKQAEKNSFIRIRTKNANNFDAELIDRGA